MVIEKNVDEKIIVAQNMMDFVELKKEIIRVMVDMHANDKLTDEEHQKFYKYLTLQLKENTSKNNLDTRIGSIYRLIQKQYNNYIALNEIINKLD